MTKKYKYFIVNRTVSVVSVNGESFEGNPVVIGPLPEFSIIEIHGRVLFWWRSRKGLDLENTNKRKRGPDNEGDEDDEDSDTSSDDSDHGNDTSTNDTIGRPKSRKRRKGARRQEAWETISEALVEMAEKKKKAATRADDTEPSKPASKPPADEVIPEHDYNQHSMLTRSKASGRPPRKSNGSKSRKSAAQNKKNQRKKRPEDSHSAQPPTGDAHGSSNSQSNTQPEKQMPGEEQPDKHASGQERPEKEASGQEQPEKQVPGEEQSEKQVSGQEQPEKQVPGEEQPGTESPNAKATSIDQQSAATDEPEQNLFPTEDTHTDPSQNDHSSQQKPTEQGGEKNGSSPSKPPKKKPSSRAERMDTWESPYDDAYIASCSRERRHLSGHPEPTQLDIGLNRNMTQEQVVVAIASVWAATLEEGRIFSFSDAARFQEMLNRPLDNELRCAVPSNVFIIPLLLPSMSKGSGSGSGDRHALAVVHWFPNRQSNVQVEIYDSDSGKHYIRDYVDLLRDILESSGWLGDVPIRLNSDHIVLRSLARSASFAAADGVHTVLNAWAVMLGLPLGQTNDAIGTDAEMQTRAYTEGLSLIRQAANGSMDFLTIEAFLYRYGFVQVPEYEDWEISDASKQKSTANFRRTQAYSMNETSLANLVDHSLAEQHERPMDRRDPYQKKESQTALHPPHSKVGMDRWHLEYQAGRLRARSRVPTPSNPESDSPAHHVEKHTWLDDMDTTLAVASIWCPIVSHTKISYTYSTPAVFSNLCYNSTKPETLDLWQAEANIFLIPLVYDSDPARDVNRLPVFNDASGHIVLVIAEKKNGRLHIKYYDSLGSNDSIVMRRYAHAFLRNTGWLGDYTLHDAHEQLMDVHSQTFATCGVHTILNAWAYMLGIEVAPVTNANGISKAAYGEALELINLALEGRADYRLIMAFMQWRRFAVPRDWQAWNDEIESQTDPNRRALDRVISEYMTFEIIHDADRHIREQQFFASS